MCKKEIDMQGYLVSRLCPFPLSFCGNQFVSIPVRSFADGMTLNVDILPPIAFTIIMYVMVIIHCLRSMSEIREELAVQFGE